MSLGARVVPCFSFSRHGAYSGGRALYECMTECVLVSVVVSAFIHRCQSYARATPLGPGAQYELPPRSGPHVLLPPSPTQRAALHMTSSVCPIGLSLSLSLCVQVIDFSSITSMYGSVHCASQVVKRVPRALK